MEFDATNTALAENSNNEPPAEGRQFVMATVQVVYRGEGTSESRPSFDVDVMEVRGAEQAPYTTFGDSCGVIPEPFRVIEVLASDESESGNPCWSVPSDDVDLVLLADYDFGEERAWFALQ